VAEQWIDAAADKKDHRVRQDRTDLRQWWAVFNDQALNGLIERAFRQNLSLREAGFRVLQARAQLAMARGDLFPQSQNSFGSFRRTGSSLNPPTSVTSDAGRFFNQWAFGFNLAWELDLWGRYRRAVEAAEASLEASAADYDGVLVTLLGDVAANYVRIRTAQERIKWLAASARVQEDVWTYLKTRADVGFRVTDLDVAQAASDLKRTAAQIPPLEIEQRQAANRLCILLGVPPSDLQKELGLGSIPIAPPEVVVGIPADLLRQRPDVRRAERLLAAQAEQIGIAQADLYPIFTINGTMGWQAREFAHLFSSKAFNGSVGPSFQWNLLNYGRIVNHVRFQDARFRELLVAYQETVLRANEEVENGLVSFLQAQERTRRLDESVRAAKIAREAAYAQYEHAVQVAGLVTDFNRYAVIERDLIQQGDLLAQARGEIALGLIQVYRALGGGWEIVGGRASGEDSPEALPPGTVEPPAEVAPVPADKPLPLSPLPPLPTGKPAKPPGDH